MVGYPRLTAHVSFLQMFGRLSISVVYPILSSGVARQMDIGGRGKGITEKKGKASVGNVPLSLISKQHTQIS